MSGLEHGKQNPTVGPLRRLARALDVPLDRLVILDGAPPAPTRAARSRT
jgi:transcriptional regulator with XRE-family HTH domain